MANDQMTAQLSGKPGFIAALDQSGGSTPGALRLYGIPDSAYSGEAEMFRLVHEMRARIITAPAFTGAKVIATILFEGTMDGEVRGRSVPAFLWEERGVVPFVKVDKGLEPENDGVSLMRPMPTLDALLTRAVKLGVFGTKMRSVIKDASPGGISAIVEQQIDYAKRIMAAGLVPIMEPEVSIDSPHKEQAEILLRDALHKSISELPQDATVMVKLTIPTDHGLYADLAADPRVLRVLALSGGYSRTEACELLAHDPVMIASFSRALLEGLTEGQSDAEFNAELESAVEEIYRAAVIKEP